MESILTHRRKENEIPSGYVILFCDSNRNLHYGDHIWTLETDLPCIDGDLVDFAAQYYSLDATDARDLVDPDDITADAGAWDDPEFCSAVWEKFCATGYRTYDGAVVLDRGLVTIQRRMK